MRPTTATLGRTMHDNPNQFAEHAATQKPYETVTSLRLNEADDTLPYFPEIYPEELLYSVVARYMSHTQMTSIKATNLQFFNKNSTVIAHDLPTGLEQFTSNIPKSLNISPQNIAVDHTLYSFYTAFMEPELKTRIKKIMISRDKTLAIRRLAYLDGTNFLRFCPQCQTDMIHRYGEAYWRREQQLPLVHTCEIHRCSLKHSTVNVNAPIRAFIAANSNNCPVDAPDIINNDDPVVLSQIFRIADFMITTLRSPPPFEGQKILRHHYHDILWRKGLMKSTSVIDNTKIKRRASLYLTRFSEAYPKSTLIRNLDYRWIIFLIHIQNFSTNPIYHVLFQDFLCDQPDIDTNRYRKAFEKFGDGPWPCFNPLVNHTTTPRVSILKERRHGRYYRGLFACECGYTYTRNRDGNNPPPCAGWVSLIPCRDGSHRS